MQHHSLPHHFTASGLVLAGDFILLVNHKRIGGWVPPGGHIEDREMPEETVVREILEETGVAVEVVSCQLNSPAGDADAFFLAQPLFVQSVLAIENGQRFYHVDLTYLCRPVKQQDNSTHLPPVHCNSEVKEASWVRLDEASNLPLARNVKEALQMLQSRRQQPGELT